MATTITTTYTVNAATIAIPSGALNGTEAGKTFTNSTSGDDPLQRAIAQEYGKNGAKSGTVSVVVT